MMKIVADQSAQTISLTSEESGPNLFAISDQNISGIL